MSMTHLLLQAQSQNLLRPLDIQFARMLADDSQPTLMLAAALTSRDTGDGHVCLALDKLTVQNCFAGQHQPLAQQLFALAGDPADWCQSLLQSQAVSEGQQATPLKLCQRRLYLHRLWHNERSVIRFFSQQNQHIAVDEQRTAAILNQLFAPTADTDWQKIAVAVALTRRIAIISGGPGTGKTTTVARLLQAIISLNSTSPTNNRKPPRIRLAAPTGKAAARLSESLGLALRQRQTDQTAQLLPDEASTLHRLLGLQQGRQRPRYHADNPLHLDILVVDEASMIDLPMMARLISALPAHARLILLGDRDQLASVEAGAVLGDLCHYAQPGYSAPRAAELSRLCGCQLDHDASAPCGELRDSLCLLRKSYRFQSDSGIGQLAVAVNSNDSAAVRRILEQGCHDLRQKDLTSDAHYQTLLADALQGYQHYLHALRQPEQPQTILQAFGEYQLLCALREGAYGVNGLNQQLERTLTARRLISRADGQRWYHGRPVMITRNDSALGLFNGDTGVALQQENGIRVWFALPDGTLKSVAAGRLPEHETAWAMTVHKSQGSEFDHVALILPPQRTPIITRELVYTAITRARKRLSLYTSITSLQLAIATRIERHSGLLQGIADNSIL